jgi:plasmid stability protein
METAKKESLSSNSFLLRFPDSFLKSKLQRRARLNGRSMNSEMLYILSKVLISEDKTQDEHYQV